MEDFLRDLLEFEARFSTEKACREYLVSAALTGFVVLIAVAGRVWPKAETLLECSRCGYQGSVTAGTIFQDSRMPVTLWFRAAWWVTSQKNGASAKGLQRVLGLKSYKTAWT